MVPAPALTFTETAKIRNRKLFANGRAESTHWYSSYDKMKRPSAWQSGGIHGTSDGGVLVRHTGCNVGSRAGAAGVGGRCEGRVTCCQALARARHGRPHCRQHHLSRSWQRQGPQGKRPPGGRFPHTTPVNTPNGPVAGALTSFYRHGKRQSGSFLSGLKTDSDHKEKKMVFFFFFL